MAQIIPFPQPWPLRYCGDSCYHVLLQHVVCELEGTGHSGLKRTSLLCVLLCVLASEAGLQGVGCATTCL